MSRAVFSTSRELLAHLAPIGLYHTTADGKCLYVNEAWCKIAGMTWEEALGDGWALAIHPDDRARVYEEWSRSAEANEPFYLIYRFRRPDGTVIWVLGQSVAHLDEAGKVIGYIGSISPIDTARPGALRMICAEEATNEPKEGFEPSTRELHLFFTSLLENMSDAVLVGGADGNVLYVNRSYRALYGDIGGILGRPLLDALAADAQTTATLAKVFKAGDQWHGELLLRRHDQSTFSAHADMFTIHEDGKLMGLAVIVQDLTEMHRAEDERAALQAQVIAAQEAAIQELLTPLLPLADHVLAMPIVGAVDRARVEQIMQTLLEGVSRHRVKVAIIDLTGVKMIDTYVANALLRAASAVRLLGVEVVLTGIAPNLARTLVEVGIDMRAIMTKSTLQDGITYALKRRA